MVFLSPKKVLNVKDDMVLCGMDEAGRGPWAGPVVACALMFKRKFLIKGLRNSKDLTREKREEIYKKLTEKAWFGVGMAEHTEVDTLGLSKATNLAFSRAIEQLVSQKNVNKPDLLVIDGRDKFTLPLPYESVIKGDEKLKVIACASIIAKVERDRIMREYAQKYPQYGFERHVGYGTKRHQQALKEHGVCDIHRKSFAPVAQITKQLNIFEK